MRKEKYILNEQGEPVVCNDLHAWASWFEKSDNQRRVRRTEINPQTYVSTIFLSLDHNWTGDFPVLWETMVFSKDPKLEQHCERCAGSREQAEAMHARVIEKVWKYINAGEPME